MIAVWERLIVNKRVVANILAILLILAVAAGLAGVMIARRVSPQVRKPQAIVPRVRAPVLRAIRDFHAEVVGYGSARPKISIEIAPEVAGDVIYRSDQFQSGRYVRGGEKGDVLFRIDPEKFDLSLRAAEAQVAQIKARITTLAQEEKNFLELEGIEKDLVALREKQLVRNRDLVSRGAGTENELELARIAWLASRKELQGTRNLLALISRRQKELQVELLAAEVRLSQARLDLRNTSVRSQHNARVIRCSVEKGEYVQAGQICGELYGVEIMEIPISIPASDLRWLAPLPELASLRDASQPETNPNAVRARVVWSEAGLGRKYEWVGQLQRIEAGLEAQTRTATLVITVNNSQQPKSDEHLTLDFNMYCKVYVQGRKIKQAFLLPRGAIVPGDYVYVVKDGKLDRQDVRVARYTDDEAMILPGGGLEEGDRVIISHVAKPVIGMRVILEDETDSEQRSSATKDVSQSGD